MRTAVGIIGIVSVMLSGPAAQSAPTPPTPTVSCDNIILTVASGTVGGYRVVLGPVSVPPAYMPQVAASGNHDWPYWRKGGLIVLGGSPPVIVSVPEAWRSRVAITWGNSGTVRALRIGSCARYGDEPWNAYAGGFLLRSRSACVPLVFKVGKRSQTIRFGVARHCK